MSDNKPLVSIITPSFNQGKYIEETLRSVLLQDYPNIEYIVIDGASTDNSVEVIERYKDRLAYFVSEKDEGQSDAINKGFSLAHGEIIAWLNSDDLYTEHAVSRAVEALRHNPDAGFVYSNVLSIDMQSEVFNTMIFGDWGLPELMRFSIICQPGVFMRKKALDAVGYLNPAYHYLMDHHLWLKIAANFPVQYIDEFWAAARYHSEAKNLTGGARYGDEAFKLLDWMRSQPLLAELINKDDKKIEAGAHHLRAHYLLDSGENWNAFKSYLKAALNDSRVFCADFQRMSFALVNSIIPVSSLRESFIERRTEAVRSKNFGELLEFIKTK